MTSEQSSNWQHDFHDWITRTTSSVDDVVDSSVRRLRKRIGQTGIPKIQPYMGYASKDTVRLHGRVLTNPPINPDFKTDLWWKNLAGTIQRFVSDEVPGVAISALVDGQLGSTISDAEGYFFVDVPWDDSNGEDLFWSPARLRIEGYDSVSPEASTTGCEVMFVAPLAKYGIISDIDDTILHTGATDIATMAKLTFFGNARTRAPLDGVAKLYELMQCQGDELAPEVNPIFYVSSSPWNLYDLLEDFLELNAIRSMLPSGMHTPWAGSNRYHVFGAQYRSGRDATPLPFTLATFLFTLQSCLTHVGTEGRGPDAKRASL